MWHDPTFNQRNEAAKRIAREGLDKILKKGGARNIVGVFIK